MLASRTLPGWLARRSGGDAANLGDFQRRRSQVAVVEPGDEFEDVSLCLATEAMPDLAVQLDLAGRLTLAMEGAEDRTLRAGSDKR
jgi:hypothetical protein